jgi:hypothetical protein
MDSFSSVNIVIVCYNEFIASANIKDQYFLLVQLNSLSYSMVYQFSFTAPEMISTSIQSAAGSFSQIVLYYGRSGFHGKWLGLI